ncbi:hypothetical protein ACPCTO_24890 [Streptomyces olivoreticuli]
MIRHAFTEAVFGPVDAIVDNAGTMLLGEVAAQPAGEWFCPAWSTAAPAR